jgi:dihydroorotate dehydrogenase (fumarate)
MANLETNYMGISLRNPVIVGACNLTLNLDTAKKLEENGAAAIVFKSLFEEQINLESIQMQEDLNQYNERHAEMITMHPRIEHAGPAEHLEKLRQLKQSLSIPVIGSLNCINHDTWVEYAVEMQKTGIDALELNFYASPHMLERTSQDIEQEQISILSEVMQKVNIPVSVKLSPFYTNVSEVVMNLEKAGVKGFVLFNHLFQPDIDIEKTGPFLSL